MLVSSWWTWIHLSRALLPTGDAISEWQQQVWACLVPVIPQVHSQMPTSFNPATLTAAAGLMNSLQNSPNLSFISRSETRCWLHNFSMTTLSFRALGSWPLNSFLVTAVTVYSGFIYDNIVCRFTYFIWFIFTGPCKRCWQCLFFLIKTTKDLSVLLTSFQRTNFWLLIFISLSINSSAQC